MQGLSAYVIILAVLFGGWSENKYKWWSAFEEFILHHVIKIKIYGQWKPEAERK